MKIPAIIIIACSLLLAITSSLDDVLIVDEVPHIGAGYSYWQKQDMRLNPEHPPLAKDVGTLPLLFLDLKDDAFQGKHWQTETNSQWEFGRKLIYNSGNDAEAITFWRVFPMLSFFVVAAVIVFVWSRKLYGDRAAFFALLFFVFSPTILAHSHFVATDVPALAGVLAASYFFLKFLRDSSKKHVLFVILALGFALLTKFSVILLIPFFLFLSLIYAFLYGQYIRTILKTIAIILGAFVFVVWPWYYWHTYHYPPERQRQDTQEILTSNPHQVIADDIVWLSDKPVLRAIGHYGLGLAMVAQRAVGGNTTYFLGEVSKNGRISYFPILYLLKEPLPWLILLSTAIIFGLKNLLGRKTQAMSSLIKNNFEQFAMLMWILGYWYVSITGNLNIGIRHLLPVYGFMIILVIGSVDTLLQSLQQKSRRAFLATTSIFGILVGWYIFENLNAQPHYLAYFNQLAYIRPLWALPGEAGRHNYVVDSNLDWGQDLKRLGDWLEQNNIKKIELDYFGWADQTYYLKDRFIWLLDDRYTDADDFKHRNRSDGWLAISATFLQNSPGSKEAPKPKDPYAWLKQFEPITTIGGSILVYRIK